MKLRNTNRHKAFDWKANLRSGFGIVELMIVMAIFAVLLSLMISRFRGMYQRNDLVGSEENIISILQRARANAMTRSQSTGVKFLTSSIIMFIDSNNNGTYDSSTDATLTTYAFRGDVQLVNGCGNNAIETGTREYVFANSKGFLGSVSGGTFTKFDWQIFLYNPKMGEAQAREIEALSNGLIEKVFPGQSGNVTTNARQANLGERCAVNPDPSVGS